VKHETIYSCSVVDSLPFKAGDYEITLNVPPDTWLNFYPAKGWQKPTTKP
jgi:hypothetical protein